MLLLIFGASGCAALIYEMVWFHLVQLVVGASSISVAVLLCSFMGGMALGSWLIPRWAPAGTSPLRLIAILEGGIALVGLLIPLVLPFVQQAYVAIVGHGFGAVLLRAAVCALILTPPTMLMGATLPVIARLHGVDVGRIYTANLAGATIGTVLAGFYLLRVHDVFIASGVAVAINIGVAIAAWWLSKHPAPFASASAREPVWRATARPRRSGLRPRRRAVRTVRTVRGCRPIWVHRIGRRGGVDATVITALRRQRLHLLAHPRGVSRRPRDWRLHRRAPRASCA